MRFLTAFILCWLVVGSIPVLVIVACEIRDHRARRRRAAKRQLIRATPEYQAAWEQHVADALRATEAASVTPLPVRLHSVPTQREGQ